MKTRLIITEEEKNRILGLHKSYILLEQDTTLSTDTPQYTAPQGSTTGTFNKPKNPNPDALVGWPNYPCVTSAAQIFQKDDKGVTLTYKDNEFIYYDNGVRISQKRNKISYYECSEGAIVPSTYVKPKNAPDQDKQTKLPIENNPNSPFYGVTVKIYSDLNNTKPLGDAIVSSFDDREIKQNKDKGKLKLTFQKGLQFKNKGFAFMQDKLIYAVWGCGDYAFKVPTLKGFLSDNTLFNTKFSNALRKAYCPPNKPTGQTSIPSGGEKIQVYN